MSGHSFIPVFVAIAPLIGCDDSFYGASNTVQNSWPVSSPPAIVVDACGGGIWIRRGSPDEVKVIVARNSSCKNTSQAAAEDSLRFIDVAMSREGDTIRIVSRRTDSGASRCYLTTSVEVYVPDGARLDLKTDVGSIWVAGSPREVKAKNAGGATAFELELPEGMRTALAQPLKLEGWGGDVEIKLAEAAYEFTGSIKAVQKFFHEQRP